MYKSSHSFVWELGGDLLTLLAPRPGDRILDLGCGTGHLTAEIAKSGANAAARSISRALRPRGRFVAELGGHGNVARLLRAVYTALEALGFANPSRLSPWLLPVRRRVSAVLESNGLVVTSAALFDRPTPLAPGRESLANWLAMFGACFTSAAPPDRRPEFLRLVEREAAPDLLEGDVWTVDYRRSRVVAVKH